MYKILLALSLLFVTLQGKDLEKISVQLLWLNQFEFAGFYMAKEKGYYKEAGLDVEIREYQQGMNVVDEVVAGNADFGVSNSTLIVDKILGKDIVALNAIFQNSPLVLIKMKDSTLNSVEDIKGKSIMASSSETNNASILTMLLSQGIKKSDVVFKEHSFNIQDLISGNIDLMTAYISNQPYIFEELGFEIDMFNPKNYGFNFYADLLFTTNKTLVLKPSVVEDFRRASIRGYEYAFSHILETVKIIEKKYNTQNKSRGALIYEANTLKDLAYTKTSNFGQIEKQKVYKIASSYQVLGLINDEYSLDGFFYEYNSPVEELKLTKEEREWLGKNKNIHLGIDNSWPPFEFEEGGKYKGIGADYMKIIQEKLGVNFIVDSKLSWSETLKKAQNRELDMLSCLAKTPKRSQYLNFTNHYLDFPMVIATSDSIAYIKSLEDLEFKKVAVVRGYYSDEMVSQRYEKIEIERFDTFKEALDALAKEDVYALVGNIASVTHGIKSSGYTNLKISGVTTDSYKLSIGVRDDWDILVGILDKTLQSITQKQKDEIYDRWINIKYEMGFDYTLFWQIAIGVIVLFSLFGYWNRRLTKEIKQREKAEQKLMEFNKTLEIKIRDTVEELEKRNNIILKQSQQAAMGNLISVIAHQLKQPMYSMNLLVESLKEMYRYKELSESNLNKITGDILNRVSFMNETIDEFKDFFRPDKKKKPFKISEGIYKVQSLLRAGFVNNGINFKIDILDDLEITSYQGEFQHVLLNILSNAKEALVERKKRDPSVWVTLRKVDEKAVLTIEDNAGGISKEFLSKVFDNYFTTKGDKGTGIGLYLSRMVIEESMGGEIVLENSEKGALFTISFNLKD